VTAPPPDERPPADGGAVPPAEADRPRPAWHAMDTEAVARALQADPRTGLAPAEAEARLHRYGPNALPEEKKRTLLAMFADQFKDFLVLILVGACVVSFALGETTDALAILAILILNALLGVVQEHRAGRALEALKRMTIPTCEVTRGGQPARISSEQVVPGDLVTLREGDLVPADLRILEAHALRVDESSLTGESEPVAKDARPVPPATPLAERTSMAYAGSVVTYGRGAGLVVATGAARELGRIAELLQTQGETITPLQRRLAGFGRLLGVLVLVICAGTFALGLARGLPGWEMFITAVSLAVAAVPEGLPAIVTVVLALGVRDMSRHRAIVRNLPAVETLGCATVICTDKTGTLTENRMRVERVWPADRAESLSGAGPAGGEGPPDGLGIAAGRKDAPGPGLSALLEAAVLCSDARIEPGPDGPQRLGDPTELALLDWAAEAGLDTADLRARRPRLAEVPFTSERKRMATLHAFDGGRRLLVKGAPEVLLPLCTRRLTAEGPAPLTEADRAAVLAAVDAMGAEALRVLAFAHREGPETPTVGEADETDLVLVGLVGMRDPPRAEAREALRQARRAGIRTIMITGDNLHTAEAIARDLGLLEPGQEGLTGTDLAGMDPETLADRLGRTSVFARVWPEQKLDIVRALQARGETVAMTGDGVNDAPALQAADIGVAMGRGGTDVAKGAADLILTDDNFATIVEAVRRGRVIFDNIRKFVAYLLACNLGEILAILGPVLAGLGSPLVPVQILLINLVTDGLPALALGMEPPEPDIMDRPPRRRTEGILTAGLGVTIGLSAAAIAAAVVAAFWLGNRTGGLAVGRTMAFVTLALAELVRAFGARSTRRALWRTPLRSNLYLAGACVVSAAVLLAFALVPPLQTVGHTVALPAGLWAAALALAIVPTAAQEAAKALARHLARRRKPTGP